ncbi:uncharacterized protein METZ01_LOCUS276576 [marine metagenome]|uniref:Uncharacterized protein n=1 Tax=marine metagenome TaxID=408172 RepID=A0A382KK41_9ZZZZ
MKDLIKNDNASNAIIYHLDEIQGGKKEQYFDELKEFERGLSGVSLWQVISTSRGVNAYQHGSSYAYTSQKIFKDRDEILFDFAEKLIKTR